MKRDLDGYPELLEDLFDKLVEFLEERGLAHQAADEAAFAVAEFFRCELAGRILYTRKKLQAKETPQSILFDLPPADAGPEGDEYLRQLFEHVCAVFNRLRVEVSQAQAHSRAIADFIQADWKGERVYVPKGLGYRDYTIWRDWDGSYGSKIRLMQKHGLGEVRFYQIVAAYRLRHRRRTQPCLPGMDEAV